MRIIVIDVEATCWQELPYAPEMETIEIGAVQLASERGPVVSEYSCFIRPVVQPILSEFCRRLTKIGQADVDSAETFPQIWTRFLEWIGPEPFEWASWGDYDRQQMTMDCERHGLVFPVSFAGHRNVKTMVAEMMRMTCGMRKAMEFMGIERQGPHHRALADAQNVARVLMWMAQK